MLNLRTTEKLNKVHHTQNRSRYKIKKILILRDYFQKKRYKDDEKITSKCTSIVIEVIKTNSSLQGLQT